MHHKFHRQNPTGSTESLHHLTSQEVNACGQSRGFTCSNVRFTVKVIGLNESHMCQQCTGRESSQFSYKNDNKMSVFRLEITSTCWNKFDRNSFQAILSSSSRCLETQIFGILIFTHACVVCKPFYCSRLIRHHLAYGCFLNTHILEMSWNS